MFIVRCMPATLLNLCKCKKYMSCLLSVPFGEDIRNTAVLTGHGETQNLPLHTHLLGTLTFLIKNLVVWLEKKQILLYIFFLLLSSWNTVGHIFHGGAEQEEKCYSFPKTYFEISLVSSLLKWPVIYHLLHLYNQFLKPLIHFYLIEWFR